AHFKPVVLLVADAGFQGYGQLFAVSDRMIAAKPDLVQRFVDASIEGWYAYLYGDPTPGNDAIKRDNPDMKDDLLAYGREAMKRNGIVDSGDAQSLGIGAMTDARWAAFTDAMVAEGVYPKGIDAKRGYTLQFVDKKVGMEMKR
ncbi:MAG: ABC transporter substrate-binding protein, partial [Acetobacteraceae bacterium]|nr:ABC transporter substrate-binding protein [Acetobacteraceae bacterium]